jgi:hypothetical protein
VPGGAFVALQGRRSPPARSAPATLLPDDVDQRIAVTAPPVAWLLLCERAAAEVAVASAATDRGAGACAATAAGAHAYAVVDVERRQTHAARVPRFREH